MKIPFFKADTEGVPFHPKNDPQYPLKMSRENLERLFSDCSDFHIHNVRIGSHKNHTVSLCFLDGVVSANDISKMVLEPLSDPFRFGRFKCLSELADMMLAGTVYSSSVKKSEDMDDLIKLITNGFCAVLFEELGFAICFEAKTNDRRHTSQPTIEKSVRGAKDAFVETIRANTSLVRRKIRNPNLKVKESVIGRQTATNVAVIYIEGLTDKNLVAELEARLEKMDTQGILGAAELEEYICDNPYTPFPQILTTERSDRFCMNLLDGRVGLFVDGLPFGYMIPGTFSQFLKVPEDRANHWSIASFTTLLRYFAFALALFLPGAYVAVAVYHQEMIPTELMLSIIESKANVPFTTVMEVFGILLAFELLQEAGLRLPTPVGETVSIIGALIVGQSAVEAQVVSPIVIIVVATAGISGYTIPSQELSYAVRLCRFVIVIMATFLGLFGIAVSFCIFVYALCSMESFGVSYMTPFVGRYVNRTKGLFRVPFFADKLRDDALKPQNQRNQK